MLSIISGAVDQCLGPGADRLLFESLVEAALASEVGVASVFLFFFGGRISGGFPMISYMILYFLLDIFISIDFVRILRYFFVICLGVLGSFGCLLGVLASFTWFFGFSVYFFVLFRHFFGILFWDFIRMFWEFFSIFR